MKNITGEDFEDYAREIFEENWHDAVGTPATLPPNLYWKGTQGADPQSDQFVEW